MDTIQQNTVIPLKKFTLPNSYTGLSPEYLKYAEYPILFQESLPLRLEYLTIDIQAADRKSYKQEINCIRNVIRVNYSVGFSVPGGFLGCSGQFKDCSQNCIVMLQSTKLSFSSKNQKKLYQPSSINNLSYKKVAAYSGINLWKKGTTTHKLNHSFCNQGTVPIIGSLWQRRFLSCCCRLNQLDLLYNLSNWLLSILSRRGLGLEIHGLRLTWRDLANWLLISETLVPRTLIHFSTSSRFSI